ncbi:hypothetical protein G9409_08950 [Chlorobium sp. BLA1]|nr:hypothetical protein [Candidatus Chlorobium masyuteum]
MVRAKERGSSFAKGEWQKPKMILTALHFIYAGGLQFDPPAQFFREADTGRISGSANEFLQRRSGLIDGGTSVIIPVKIHPTVADLVNRFLIFR